MVEMDGRSTYWKADFSVSRRGQRIAITFTRKEVSNLVKDPVCGMEIDPEDAAAETEYQGKTYYFCSEQCQETFQANPNNYVQKMRA